jgi:hypothetical protein
MARGWESKSVEDQIASAAERSSHKTPASSPEQLEKNRKREVLLLSRARVLHDLEVARNDRYRVMLEHALRDLDAQIAGLA